MAVKIRLSRIGKKKAPCYRIVAVDSRKKRDGAYLENLGTYDAVKGNIVKLDKDRIDYWVSKGAVVADSVKKLIKKHRESTESTEDSKEVKKVKEPKKDKAKEALKKVKVPAAPKSESEVKSEPKSK